MWIPGAGGSVAALGRWPGMSRSLGFSREAGNPGYFGGRVSDFPMLTMIPRKISNTKPAKANPQELAAGA